MEKTVEAEEKQRPDPAGRSSGMGMRLRAKFSAFATGFTQHPLTLWITRTLRGFSRDRCLLRAAALTYATVLALVPLLSVVLALLKGAGFEVIEVHTRLLSSWAEVVARRPPERRSK